MASLVIDNPLVAEKAAARRDVSPKTLLLVLLLAVSCFYINLARDSYQEDFRAFYLAAVTTHDHLDPYQNHVDLGEQYAHSLWDRADSLFIYPPSALFFLYPLHWLHYPAAKIAFGTLVTFAMVGILWGLYWRFPRQALLLFALFLTLPMVKSIDNGNIDVLILALVLGSFYLEDGAVAGALLGVAIAVKLAPVLVVAWMVSRGRWKTGVSALATAGALFGAAYLRWGGAYWREFVQHLVHHEDDTMPVLHHHFVSIAKIGWRFLVTPDGVFAFQHDICGYEQNPLHVLGHARGPVGLVLMAAGIGWLCVSKRGRALTAERSFFLFLVVALLANYLLWPMGLVACFPLIVLLVEESETPNLTAVLLVVPYFLTQQIVGNWNFGWWLAAAVWCLWRSGWLRGISQGMRVDEVQHVRTA